MENSDVKLNTGSSGGEQENLLSDIETQKKIDALLKLTADECNSEIDFEEIKRRALAANKKRRKRGKLFEHLALTAAVCLMLIGAAAVIKEISLKEPVVSDKNKAAQFSENPAFPVNSPGNPFSVLSFGYVSCEYIGTAENVSDLVKHISEAFRKELPPYMDKRRDTENDTFIAKGTDSSGNYRSCDCTMVSAPPYRLEPGQLGKIKDELVFFWQIKRDACLRISFIGFDEKEAQALIERISTYHP